MKLKQYLTENTEYEVKHKSGKSVIKTNISPEERSFKNLPKDGTKKNKVRFQDWLMIDGKKRSSSHSSLSYGKAANGKWYGWSHRAVYGFKQGDVVKKGSIGNKHDIGLDWDEKGKDFEPYEIKSDKEAMEHAIRFAEEVS